MIAHRQQARPRERPLVVRKAQFANDHHRSQMIVARHRPRHSTPPADHRHHPRADRQMIKRGKLGRLVVGGQSQAKRRRRGSHQHERQRDKRQHPRRRQIRIALEPDREQCQREDHRRQPHVGIGRSEDHPRQQDEHRAQHQHRKGEVARQHQSRVDQGEQHDRRRDHRRTQVEPPPPIAQHGHQPGPFGLEIEPVEGHSASGLAAPDEHQDQWQGQRRSVPCGADPRQPPASSAVMLAHRFGRKRHQPEHAPAERMGEEDDQRQRNEQRRAQPRLAQPPEPQPQSEGEKCQCDRQREIDEAEHQRVAISERQREHRGRRKAVVHLARHPQHPRHCQHGDRDHDQLGPQLEPEQLGHRDDQQVDPQIADQRPLEPVILLQARRRGEIELHPIASHMPDQVGQRRNRRVEKRHRRKQDHRHDERSAFPPRAWAGGSGRCSGRDQARSRRPSSLNRNAFSLMNPSASRWS